MDLLTQQIAVCVRALLCVPGRAVYLVGAAWRARHLGVPSNTGRTGCKGLQGGLGLHLCRRGARRLEASREGVWSKVPGGAPLEY